MSFCESCGKKVGENSKFCENCGTPVDSNKPASEPKKIVEEKVTVKKNHKGLFHGKELIISGVFSLILITIISIETHIPALGILLFFAIILCLSTIIIGLTSIAFNKLKSDKSKKIIKITIIIVLVIILIISLVIKINSLSRVDSSNFQSATYNLNYQTTTQNSIPKANCYYESVPYEEQEAYSVEEPYLSTEYYQAPITYEVIKNDKGTTLHGINVWAINTIKIMNTDSEGGLFTVTQTFETLTDDPITKTSSYYINPQETKTFVEEIDISLGEDFIVDSKLTIPDKTLSRQVTKYTTVTKYRTVTKYQQVEVC